MEIYVNGQAENFQSDQTIQKWLEYRDLSNKRIAIEVNGMIIPKSLFATTYIKQNDEIEVIRAVGGG